jgi:hypothetical protein
MADKLTFSEIQAKVRALAEERPDFQYDSGTHLYCQYNGDDQQPGCIFGQALTALGQPVKAAWEGRDIDEVFDFMGVPVLEAERRWALGVQIEQDGHREWGEAIKHADSIIAGL